MVKTAGETLFSRFSRTGVLGLFLEGLVSAKLLQPKRKLSWQMSPGSFSLNPVALFVGAHNLLLFASREDAERFLFLVLLLY